MKKKIVIYINSMHPSGGIERVISNLSNAWTDKYDLVLLTKDDGDSFYPLPENIQRVSLKMPMVYDMNNLLQRTIATFHSFGQSKKALSHILPDLNPDYIYTATPLNGWEITALGENFQKRLVVSEHGSYYGYNKFWTAIKKRVYPKAYCVSVLNQMDTEIYKSWGCNAVYVPHLITFPAIKKNSLTSKIAINVGRLTNDKRQELLIDMWCNIKHHNGWKLWIVGDGENKELLQKKISERRCEKSVTLIPATKDIDKIYEQSSLFLFTSSTEGFGMVLLEAMSFGVPCLSFDCPSGPRDIIRNGENGYLIENSNGDKFQEKLQEVLEMPIEDLQRLGSVAFETVKQWDNEEILGRWDSIFQ